MTTYTPRTDAAEPQLHSNVGGWVRADFARQLERELAVSLENELKTQAEVERLTKELAAWDYGTRAKREQDARKKAESEVERLKSQLKRAMEIAEMFRQVKGLHYQCNCAMCQLLGDLKGELK